MKRLFTRGLSLPEAIVYVAVLSIIMLAVVQIMLALSSSYAVLKVTARVERSASTAMDRMIREIRHARDIDSANSSFGANPGTLTLSTTDASGNPLTIQFFVSSSTLKIKEGNADAEPLTATGTAVTNLVFRSLATTTSKAVKIELQITASQGTTTVSNSYYSTAVLRGYY